MQMTVRLTDRALMAGISAEEQEAGATADTGTAADASTDTQDDSTEN